MTQKRLAQLSMVIITIIWGVTFVMVKEALNDAPPYMFASLRFGLAFFIGLIYLNKSIINITHLEMTGGLVCGLCLFAGYAFQNYGLMQTTPSKSAFITSVSVILVPIILSVFKVKKIDFKIWISVFLATVGLYILLNPSGGQINIGDILTFGCALSFAIHIIIQDRYNKDRIINFFVIQSLVASILSLLGSLIVEDISKIVFSREAISAILITGIFGTTFALLVMIWAQKILSASETAIIIAMEPVFAALFSVYFGYEILGLLSYLGAAIVVLSIIFCELSRNTELAN